MKPTFISTVLTNIRLTRSISALFIIVGFVEGLWGVMQIFGVVPSGHTRLHVTGSFYNPGPYGCFLAIIFPIALYTYFQEKNKFIRIVCLAYFIICLFLLPGGLSRSAWLAIIAGGGFVFFFVDKFKIVGRNRLIVVVSLVIAGLLAVVAIYLFKQDSADGRLLIWKIASGTLDDIPLGGVGWQNVAGTYGDAQEAYFASGAGTPREILLADAPSYVYNEYLQVAMAFGPFGVLMMIIMLASATVIFIRNKQYGFAGCVVAFSICCVSSYPLQFREFKVMASLLIIFAALLLSGPIIRPVGVGLTVILCMLFCINTMNYDVDKVYEQAHRYASCGKFEKANQLTKALMAKCSSAELLLFVGNNYQALGIRDSSAHYYERAAKRIPNRLYPHYRLMELWLVEPADSAKAKEEAEILMNMTPKVESVATMQMKQAAEQLLWQMD